MRTSEVGTKSKNFRAVFNLDDIAVLWLHGAQLTLYSLERCKLVFGVFCKPMELSFIWYWREEANIVHIASVRRWSSRILE